MSLQYDQLTRGWPTAAGRIRGACLVQIKSVDIFGSELLLGLDMHGKSEQSKETGLARLKISTKPWRALYDQRFQ